MDSASKKKAVILLLLLSPAFISRASHGADLYAAPTKTEVQIERTVSVPVYVSSADTEMNAAGVTVRFPTDMLQAVSVDKSGSIFNLWPQEPIISNSAGTVFFEGVALNPGYKGSAGKLVSIVFKAKRTGTASILLSGGSVLANDGEGTNILSQLKGAVLKIISPPPVAPKEETKQQATPAKSTQDLSIRSTTHPDPERWYSTSNAQFEWTLPSAAEGAAWALGGESVVPDTASFVREATQAIINLDSYDDGTRYFGMRAREEGVWGKTSRYQVNIDRKPPERFAISIEQENQTDPSPRLKFSASDQTSGVERYEVRIGQGSWFDAEDIQSGDSYRLSPQKPGEYKVFVKAIDKAGNSTEAENSFKVLPTDAPTIISYPLGLKEGNSSLIFKGIAAPGSRLFLRGSYNGSSVVFDSAVGEDGRWEIIEKMSLASGRWEFFAESRDDTGRISLPSNKVYVRIVPLWLSAGYNIGAWWVVLVFLAILIMAGYTLLNYIAMSFKNMLLKAKINRAVKREEYLSKVRALIGQTSEIATSLSGEAKNLPAGFAEEEKAIGEISKDVQREQEDLNKDQLKN